MTTAQPPQSHEQPIQDFSQCHAGILGRLDLLGELPALLAPAARAREIAEKSVEFFREAIFEHHLDEERELFPAVQASAQPGAELDHVQALARRLTDEHRELEKTWKQLEPELKKMAKGHAADVSVSEIERLVTQYRAHARFEESDYLPLAEKILGRNANHMSALGLSLHMRHTPFAIKVHI